MYAFVDGAVDVNRRRDQGGAGFGGTGVVLIETNAGRISSYRVVGVPFWPHSMFISNNTMEIMAVQVACNLIHDRIMSGKDVHIWTDSEYAQGVLSFGSSWMPKKNAALIDFVRRATARTNVLINHCKGHAGFAWNELANTAAQKAVEMKHGFDRTVQSEISKLCFGCVSFPCLDLDKGIFGVSSSRLANPRSYNKKKCANYAHPDHVQLLKEVL